MCSSHWIPLMACHAGNTAGLHKGQNLRNASSRMTLGTAHPPTSVSSSIKQKLCHLSHIILWRKERKQFPHNSFVESRVVWKIPIFLIIVLTSGSSEYTALDSCAAFPKGWSSFVLIADKEGQKTVARKRMGDHPG